MSATGRYPAGRIAGATLAWLLLAALSCAAQSARSSPSLTGTVRDANGGVLPGVTVALMENGSSKVLQTGMSGGDGTLTSPGVADDSNGSFHPLGEHAETSLSIDNQPVSDQQSRTFSNQLSPNAIESIDVETGVPSAEFGDKTSLIATIKTRSGLGM